MPARSTPAPSNPEPLLLRLIRKRIRGQGPMSVADFMELALNHPKHGYYHQQDPFGAAGDFVTAPEISQTFGELLGLWLATAWQGAGRPGPFQMVELGPGRGQLMADMIRATGRVPGFLDAADIHLVESSQRLRTVQRAALAKTTITWHERLATVPAGPLFLIANEFFDALPVHQLIRSEVGWAERKVTWNNDEGLTFVEGHASPELIGLIPKTEPTKPGQIAEVSPSRSALARQIGERIRDDGGVALFIDYGAWVDHVTGETLQALRGHQRADPLGAPGKADLTSHVDFRSLGEASAAGGANVFGPVPQGTFLRALGIEARTAALLRHADEDQRRQLRHGLFRLTDASAMGELFKGLALSAPAAPPPPGFETPTLSGRS